MSATKDGTVQDPDLYERMSVPHESFDKALESYKAFFAEISAARERYRIRDVVIVSMLSWREGERTVGQLVVGHRGSAPLAVPMLAEALGELRRVRDAELDRAAGVSRQKRATKGKAKR